MEAGKKETLLKYLAVAHFVGPSHGLELIRHIDVPPIALMSVGNQDILITVQIHIQKGHTPGPVGRRKPGPLADFRVGQIASIHLQGGFHELRPVVGVLD